MIGTLEQLPEAILGSMEVIRDQFLVVHYIQEREVLSTRATMHQPVSISLTFHHLVA